MRKYGSEPGREDHALLARIQELEASLDGLVYFIYEYFQKTPQDRAWEERCDQLVLAYQQINQRNVQRTRIPLPEYRTQLEARLLELTQFAIESGIPAEMITQDKLIALRGAEVEQDREILDALAQSLDRLPADLEPDDDEEDSKPPIKIN